MVQITSDYTSLVIYNQLPNDNIPHKCVVTLQNWGVVEKYIDTHVYDVKDQAFYKKWIKDLRNHRTDYIYLSISSEILPSNNRFYNIKIFTIL